MAEFIGITGERSAVPGSGDGFDAMGKPIPSYRRQAAYAHCKDMGLDAEASWSAVSGMADQLERDKPYEAMEAGMRWLDLTGTYRLMAVLLTAEKPRVRVSAGRVS